MHTNEQKAALKIHNVFDSIALDVEEVGRILGRGNNLTYNRVVLMAEAMEEEKAGHSNPTGELPDDIEERFNVYANTTH